MPICERRFLDKDTVGRMASTILERALRYEVAMCGFDSTMRRVRNDYLIPGRGQNWVRYTPKFGEPISPKQTADDDITAEGGTELVDEGREGQVENEVREFLAESLSVTSIGRISTCSRPTPEPGLRSKASGAGCSCRATT